MCQPLPQLPQGEPPNRRRRRKKLRSTLSRAIRAGRVRRNRECDAERCATSEGALGRNVTAELLDDVTTDGETEPGRFSRGLRREVRLEDLPEVLRGDAGPRVRNLDGHATLALRPGDHADEMLVLGVPRDGLGSVD